MCALYEPRSPQKHAPATTAVTIPDLTGIDFALLRLHIDNLEAAYTEDNSAPRDMHNDDNFVKLGKEFLMLERQYLTNCWMISGQVDEKPRE